MSATELCKSCGLCCKGVWFTHGSISDAELPQAKSFGFPFEVYSVGQGFAQPCAMHKNGCCSAYASWRPKVCIDYSCAALNEYRARKITFEQTLARINIAKKLVDEIPTDALSAPGGLMGGEFVRRLSASVSADAREVDALSPSACISSLALRVCFDKYFRVPEPKAEPAELDVTPGDDKS